MIKSFSHKGLERFHREGSLAGIQPIHAKKLRLILALLGQARSIDDMNAPGLRLHPLQGNLQGYCAVTVQANWRVTFRFEDGDVYVVDYVDYH
jgi:proteic killer suppression protein